MLDDTNIRSALTVLTVSAGVAIVYYWQLLRRRRMSQQQLLLQRGRAYAAVLAQAYTQVGECTLHPTGSASLYQLENGSKGIRIILTINREDALCIQRLSANGRAELKEWAAHVANGASLKLRGEDFQIILTSAISPLATVSQQPGHGVRITVTPLHPPNFGED